jgi:hypothetical protein
LVSVWPERDLSSGSWKLRRNGIQVLGLAESTPEAARQKAAELGISRSYDSFEAMLADPEIDVVHLATPNLMHHPHAKAALLAGKHVICEKPLAMTASESAELVKLAIETGRVNAVNFNIRTHPSSRPARCRAVRSGSVHPQALSQVGCQQRSTAIETGLAPASSWRYRFSLADLMTLSPDCTSKFTPISRH